MGRMKSGAASIFSQADYKTLIDTRRLLNDLIVTMDKAESCGLNCAVWRQQRADLDKQLEMIQQHFMTPPPS
jgi:hypothetical protein